MPEPVYPRPFEDIERSVADAVGRARPTQLLADMMALVTYHKEAERALAESRAEVERLRGHAEALAECAVLRCFEEYRDVRWCDSCSDPEHCPVAAYRRDYPETTPARPRTLSAAEVPDDR